MARQQSFDLNKILRYQQRHHAWHYVLQWIGYWSQWIGAVVTGVAAFIAVMSAIFSWFSAPWLIAGVAICSAIAQLIQTFVQVKLNSPQRDIADKTLRGQTDKQKSQT